MGSATAGAVVVGPSLLPCGQLSGESSSLSDGWQAGRWGGLWVSWNLDPGPCVCQWQQASVRSTTILLSLALWRLPLPECDGCLPLALVVGVWLFQKNLLPQVLVLCGGC